MQILNQYNFRYSNKIKKELVLHINAHSFKRYFITKNEFVIEKCEHMTNYSFLKMYLFEAKEHSSLKLIKVHFPDLILNLH